MNTLNSAGSRGDGAQRHSLERLQRWEALGYGMFIHFGMSTYDGDELSRGDKPASAYAPDRLDVDQWVQVARDAGMKYAVLTTKHTAGFCLWPSRHTDYTVAHSGNRTDVVEAFVKSCEKRGVLPGFYYCSWDNHHTLGSVTPLVANEESGYTAFTTQKYRDFQLAQVEELLTRYGPIDEVWIDIPNVLGGEGRIAQYQQIARLQPDAVVMMNHSFGDGQKIKLGNVWPTDLMTLERSLPASLGYERWHRFSLTRRVKNLGASRHECAADDPKDYYIPGEVCDPIGYEWFFVEEDRPRSDDELLGMRLICRSRHVNLLLNVPPDRSGRMPRKWVDALLRMQRRMEQLQG